jgi:hypothetical protein
MNQEEQKEYEEKMGSPEMEYLQYQSEHPELNQMTNNKQWEIELSKKDNTVGQEIGCCGGDGCIWGDIGHQQRLKSFIQQTLDTERSELLSQIKGIGCDEGVDLVTVARIINKLNGHE